MCIRDRNYTGKERTHFPGERNGNNRGNQCDQAKTLELIPGEQSHREPDKDRQKDDHGDRSHANPVALVEKVIPAEWRAMAGNPL